MGYLGLVEKLQAEKLIMNTPFCKTQGILSQAWPLIFLPRFHEPFAQLN